MSGKGAKLAQTTCQAMELHVKTWVPQSVNTVPNKIVVYVILILSFSCLKARLTEASVHDFICRDHFKIWQPTVKQDEF